jgi:succinate dehydrogenase / fumarate reductase, membrane anchor subunit
VSRMQHPLARARGHGSAKSGVHHWLAQRVSAGMLVLLLPWLAYSLLHLAGASHEQARAFAAEPWNATLLLLSLLLLLYHGMLGLQVVIEDYVHHRALELSLHFVARAATLLAATLGIIHLLKLTLGA